MSSLLNSTLGIDRQFLKRNGAWLGFLLLLVVLSSLTHGDFLSPRNLTNLLRQTSINGILAGGMTFVILSGGIDLSIGSLVALCGILVGVAQVKWSWAGWEFWGAWISIGMALGAGLTVGTLTGALIAFLGIPPFVITLGIMVIARGLALIFSGGESLAPMGDGLQSLSTESFEGPSAWICVLIVALLFATLLYRPSMEFSRFCRLSSLGHRSCSISSSPVEVPRNSLDGRHFCRSPFHVGNYFTENDFRPQCLCHWFQLKSRFLGRCAS